MRNVAFIVVIMSFSTILFADINGASVEIESTKFNIPRELRNDITGSMVLGKERVITSPILEADDTQIYDELYLKYFDNEKMNSNCAQLTTPFKIPSDKQFFLASELAEMKCTVTCPPNTCDPEIENCGPREGCTKTCTDVMSSSEFAISLGQRFCNSLLNRN